MDLDKLSLDDLKALRSNNLDAMSLEGLQYLKSARTPVAPEAPPDTGFTGALKSSAEQIQADYERIKGKLGFKSVEEAEKAAQEHEQKAQKVFKPTEEGWLEAPWTKLKETAGGSLPYMALPVAAGAAALALPEAVAAAPVLGGLATAGEALGMGAAGLTSAAQFTGSNLSRQVQEGKSLQDASLMQAAAAAIPQAALDVVGLKYVPGIQKIFKSVGQDISEQAAKKMLEQGTLRTAGQYIAGGAKIAGIEGATEAGQQFFERLQAGLNIADADARKEYLDNFIGGAALGAVAAPFGVHGERTNARNVVNKAQAERDEQARIAQEEADKQAAETAAAQKEMQGVAPKGPTELETAQKEAQVKQSAIQIADQRRVLENRLNELRQQASGETDLSKLTAISEEANKYHTALDELDPEKVKDQIASLTKEKQVLSKQLKAVKDDPEATAQIQASIDENNKKTDTLNERFEALNYQEKQAATADQIESKIAAKQKALEKAKETGDLQSIGKIISSINELQKQHPGRQAELFEGAGEDTTYPEYQKRLAEEARQRQAKSQEVLDQEAILNQQQQEIEESTGEKPKLSKYKEEMTSDEYTDLLAQKLVDLHTRPDTHVPGTLTPAQKAAETKRVAAITALKSDFETKVKEYEDLVAQVDELGGPGKAMYTARGDVAAMGKKLDAAKKALFEAKGKMIAAIPEGTKTPVESGKVSAIAQDVHLLDLTDTIDSMRKGEWFGGPNPKAASGFLPALAEKARASLDKYLQSTVSNINYSRLQKGLPRLTEAEKEDIVKQVDGLMSGKIQRATGKKAAELRMGEDTQVKAALEKAGFKFPAEKEIETGFHRNEYKDVQKFVAGLKNKYTNAPGAEIGKLQKETPEAKSRYAVQKALAEKQAKKTAVTETKTEQTDTDKIQQAFTKAQMLYEKWSKESAAGDESRIETRKDYVRALIELDKQLADSDAKPELAKAIKQLVETNRLSKKGDAVSKKYSELENTVKTLASKEGKELFAKPAVEKGEVPGQKEAVQQTGLGLGGKKQTFEPAEKLQAALPHQGPKVEAAFNFAKQYFKEWNARKSLIMNDKQRLALKEARQKYIESRAKLNQQFKNSRVDPRIAKIMNWMVTADEKTARYRKAENLIIGLEEKMQQQVFAKTPKKQIETIAPAKKEEQVKLTEKEKELKQELGYTPEEKEAEETVGRISEMGLAKLRKKMQDRVDFITNRLEAQKAPVKDRESLVKEKDKLLKQIKATSEVINARRVGMIVGQAQEEKGAKKYKATKTEKKMVKEGKLEEKGITPLAYDMVLKAYNENIKTATPVAEFEGKIKTLAAIELRLERGVNMTTKRRKEIEKLRKKLRGELTELAGPAAETQVSAEEEAKELGIDPEAYKRMLRAMDIGFQPRVGEGKSSGIQMLRSAAQAVVDKVTLPKGLNVTVIQDLSPTMKQYILERGFNPAFTKGFVTENGDVVIVAGNHKTAGEVAETLAHEITGHLGVEAVLGKEGMAALVKKITTQEGGVIELANKLGVGDDAHAAYAAALNSGQTKEQALEAAVHEMIAHVAEKRPTKDFIAKANEFIKAMVGEVRAALRRMGIKLDTSTSDIYKILRDARRDFKEVTPGAYKEANGNIQFSSKPKYNSNFADLGGDVGRIVQASKTVRDKVHAAAVGMKTPSDIIKTGGTLSPENRLSLRTRYIDRFAPVEKVAEKLTNKLGSSLEGTQLMYYLRMFDQGINWVAQTASHGPMSIIEKKRADGKIERLIETKEGASMLKVSQALKEANVGDANAANQLFTFYLAAKRAARVGLDTLNFSKDVTQEMLDRVMTRINSDAKTKASFEKAAGIYNEYNRGLVEFGVQTGRFSKEEAAKLLKENDYVPFYRIAKDGSVMLEMGGATPIHIGNIKDQPYLHELVGGDTAIMDVFTSALQNTRMLTDMALRNLATRNVAFSLQELGLLNIKKARSGKDFGSGIYQGKGPAGVDVIRFKIDGVDHHAIVDTESIGIPAELLVKGMDGVQTSIPNLVKVLGFPAKLLRSFITRNPAYAIRQIARDSLSNAFVTGSNSVPIIDNMKQLSSMLKGVNEGELLLKRRGVLGGQVLGNASDAMQKAMLQIIDGKPGWEKAMAYLDHVAMMGDASSRVTSYNSFVKQGLSDMEATLASLEAMNFSKRGTSPSLYLLNQMVPFLNAQIQGMDVLYKAFAGKMPFADKLDIKRKIWQRGAMMAAFTMAYTAMSYDDDDYQNATPAERIGNWFIKVPGIDEKVKVPIPFEVGGIFKMLPEMLYSTAFKDKKLGEAASETASYVVDNFIPSFIPTAIKPGFELGANYSFFTGKPIESQRLRELAPGERAYSTTPEVLKTLGGITGISPVQMEYLIRSYTGSLPLAVLSLANPISGGGEAPEGRGALSSTTPVIGAFFQPKDGSGLVEKAYDQMGQIIQADKTYKNYIDSGRDEEAEAYLTKEADLIGMANFSGQFRQQMGVLAKQERAIRSMTGISGAEKRAALDEIKEAKIELSKSFLSARE